MSSKENKKQNQKQKSLSDRYNPQEVESRIYKWWEEKGYFEAEDVSTKPPFSIILPPPNITGSLHLGHALDHAIQDVLVRWKRMSGYNTLWMPGTDHAGIATQMVVERDLSKKEGKSRHDLGREKFVEKIWEWKKEYGGRITEQMRRLGNSCDWNRETFTLDDGVSQAVRRVFVSLYDKGLIYKGERLVNWSPPLESAISDLEVVHKEMSGSLWHIRYSLAESKADSKNSQELIVATTRPETLLGDTAVCVHPSDTRYKSLIGKKVKLPLTNRLIPIISDEYVDKEFGSGVVKITPAHDFNDYEVGLRHDLEKINILNKNGTLNENSGVYEGLKVGQARKKIVEDLEAQGFLEKTQPHKHSVGHCDRSGAVVEPYLSEQWFMKTSDIAVPAKHVVESGTICFKPESWTKTYLHWMRNIQDWCISRQLWWGHRIPAFHCQDCENIMVKETPVDSCSKCGSKNIKQDEDVLDTWFSSALWPFSTMGWPEQTETLKTFYPTDVLVTGHDIIFFWVARMIMSGLEFKEDVPFRTVYIHGLIRDSQGRKMSKSVGNSVDPLVLLDEYGADALRYTLMASVASGRDLKFSEQRLEGYRNFINKLWNAARFSLSILKDSETLQDQPLPSKDLLSVYDQWILYKLGTIEKNVNQSLEKMAFSEATSFIYSFVWHEFCDWYLEFIKPIVYGEEDTQEKQATCFILSVMLNRIVRLMHPFAPFVTEEIYNKLPIRGEALIVDEYPRFENDQDLLERGCEQVAKNVDLIKEVISALRNIRGENRLKPGDKIKAVIVPKGDKEQRILLENTQTLIGFARLKECQIIEAESQEGSAFNKCAVSTVIQDGFHVTVAVPLEGLVDFDEEIKRIKKSIEKTGKDIQVLTKKLSNKKFLAHAASELVEADRQVLAQHQAKQEALAENLKRLE